MNYILKMYFVTHVFIPPQSLSSQERNTYKEYNSQVSNLFYNMTSVVVFHVGVGNETYVHGFLLLVSLCDTFK